MIRRRDLRLTLWLVVMISALALVTACDTADDPQLSGVDGTPSPIVGTGAPELAPPGRHDPADAGRRLAARQPPR